MRQDKISQFNHKTLALNTDEEIIVFIFNVV